MVAETRYSSIHDPRLPMLVPGWMNPSESSSIERVSWETAAGVSHGSIAGESLQGIIGLSPNPRLPVLIAAGSGPWVAHWPSFHHDDAVEAPREGSEQVGSKHAEGSRPSLLRRHWLPILMASVGGTLLGLLFSLVAIAAVLLDSWAYAATFSFAALALTLGPVSLVVAYLRWDDRMSAVNSNHSE